MLLAHEGYLFDEALVSRRECRRIVEADFSGDRMIDEYIRVHEQILAKPAREDHRPWGYYLILSDCDDHKVKRIVVYPGVGLSLQPHKYSSEQWTITNCNPVVTLDKEELRLNPGDSIGIPVGTMHRIQNPGLSNVVFAEVQTGSYLGEDDIRRFEDDYDRARGILLITYNGLKIPEIRICN
jgi:mannose-6-phosphate isomerase